MSAASTLFQCAFLALVSLSAQAPTGLDQLVEEGQDAMYRMEYGAAREVFARIIGQYPDSPVGYGMMSIVAWNEMFFAAANPALHEYGSPNPYSDTRVYGSLEAERRRFHEANDALLAVTGQILEQDAENVLALYFEGLAYENLAAEAVAVGKDRWGAVGPGRKAKGLHDKVLALDLDFVDAKVSISGYEFALATVRGFSRMVLSIPRLFGFFRGDKDEAFELMEEVATRGRFRDVDAQFLLFVMHASHGDPLRSVSILEELRRRYPENYLIDLNLAGVQALKLGDAEAALATYQALLNALPEKTPGLGAGEVWFRMGKTHLGIDKPAEARAAFQEAVNSVAVEAETHPLSYFYLGLIAETEGSEGEARGFYRQFVTLGGSMESLEQELEAANRKLR